jgi:hypothetical protein
VRGRSGEEGACALGGETRSRESPRRPEALQAEPRENQGVPRQMDQRTEKLAFEVSPTGRKWGEQLAVDLAVDAEHRCGLVHRPPDQQCRAVVERVGERSRWLD